MTRPRLPESARRPALNAARFSDPVRLAAATALVALLAIATSGCLNPFRPAKAEAPAGDDSQLNAPIDFATPEGLLQTLSAAVFVKGHGNGVAAYMGAFADPATQGVPLQIDLDQTVVDERTRAGVRVPEWTRSYEPDFYNYLVSRDPGEYSLQWEPYGAGDVDDAADHAIRYREYHVTATAADGYTLTDIALGRAEIELRRISGSPARWVITRWTDSLVDTANVGRLSFSRIRIDSYNR